MATTTENKAFAVIETGGKQYLAHEGDTMQVELLGDYKEGDSLTFDTVLMTDNGSTSKIGTPYLDSKVTATYLGTDKGPKITILRYKAKSNRNRKQGHRQKYSLIKIEKIT